MELEGYELKGSPAALPGADVADDTEYDPKYGSGGITLNVDLNGLLSACMSLVLSLYFMGGLYLYSSSSGKRWYGGVTVGDILIGLSPPMSGLSFGKIVGDPAEEIGVIKDESQ